MNRFGMREIELCGKPLGGTRIDVFGRRQFEADELSWQCRIGWVGRLS